jgi:SAM-dependent methyltransferase
MSHHADRHTAFNGAVAEVYDTFYEGKPYPDEAKFVRDRLCAAGVPFRGRLLEIACGTAKHAVELARLGFQVTATDYSQAMLAKARVRACEAGIDITVFQQDMCELNLDAQPFDAAICLFDSIGYAVTNEGLFSTFTGIRRHLVPGGVFLFEFWHAPAMLCYHEPVRVQQRQLGDVSLFRISETTLDVESQTASVTYTILRTSGPEPREYRETVRARFFSIPEMELILAATGWRREACWAGFNIERPIEADTWHIVMLARSV